ncbi:MAG: tRNA1(Val) (adenine(37)-N6)-methyltransferase [Deltaproteobacteria bacterium]|nr:tRNA1(Val) (adenine(37)-N6)-methyltransferase [Deltaproteobacteria bacterium]
MNKPLTSTDSLFDSRLKIIQKRKGYRFSVDAAILAHHVHLKPTDVAVDLGTGCGVIPLILALQTPSAHIYGIEIQKDLAEFASRNVQLNGMEASITIVHRDMKDLKSHLAPGTFDVVFSNPPYREALSGRINPEEERAVARHEIKATLSDVVSVAESLLKPSGRFVVIYPAARAIDLVLRMRAFKLEPKRLRLIHPKQGSEAILVVAEGVKHGNPGLDVSSPLTIYTPEGSYTDEAGKIMGEEKTRKLE